MIRSNSKIIDIRETNDGKDTIIDVYPTEIDHNALKNTGGDPHPQYLDPIRHSAISHDYFYIMGNADIFVTPPIRIKKITIISEIEIFDAKIDITKNGISILEKEIYTGKMKNNVFFFDIPTIIDGMCKEDDIIKIVSNVSNLYIRFDFW